MTRFETDTGIALGFRFAGDQGATMRLTRSEAKALFRLPFNAKIKTDNSWEGETVKDLINLVVKSPKCSDEEFNRRFK